MKEKARRSWSISAFQTFKRCLRAYCFAYVIAPDYKYSPLSRKVAILTRARPRNMWVGRIVHKLISEVLSGKLSADVRSVQKAFWKKARQQFELSYNGILRETSLKIKDDFYILLEHATNQPLEWEEIQEDLLIGLRAFRSLPLIEDLRKGRKAMDIEDIRALEVDLIHGEIKEVPVNNSVITNILDLILLSAREMCLDGGEDVWDLRTLPYPEDMSKCQRCAFKVICKEVEV